MKVYHVWIGIFEESEFEQYWDNEPYENEIERKDRELNLAIS